MKVAFKTKNGKTVSFNTGKKNKKKNNGATKKKRRRTKKIYTKKGITMAKKRSFRRSGSSGSMKNLLLGAAAAGFIGNMIPFGSYGKVGTALLVGNKGGVLGDTAKALGVLGVADLVSGVSLSGLTQSITGAVQTTSSGGNW